MSKDSLSRILNKILLSNETKLLSGLSFFIISLLSLHFIFYLNFYNFSGNWLSKESKTVTLQITPMQNEKRVKESVKDELVVYFSSEKSITNYEIFDDQKIKDIIGLNDLHSFSSIRIPLLIKLNMANLDYDIDLKKLIDLTGGSVIKAHYHKEDLFEINDLIYRVKLFIFLFGTVFLILFIFLLTLLLKITFKTNYKFLEIIQIMGADSKSISLNLIQALMKKILPGALIGMIFINLTSTLIIEIFKVPLNSSLSIFYMNDYLSNLFLLLLFVLAILFLLFSYLLIYLYYFLEKRFFV